MSKELKEYALLMLGAPVVEVDLTDEELEFCVTSAQGKVEEAMYPDGSSEAAMLLQEGVWSLARYIVAKKKFNRRRDDLTTPDGDGFAEMTQADSDWAEFIGDTDRHRLKMARERDQ